MGAIDGCLFYGNVWFDAVDGAYRRTMFEARATHLNRLGKELCPSFKNIRDAFIKIPKTRQFLNGLSNNQRRQCRQEVACVKRSGSFFGIPLTAECEHGGVKYEERHPTFGSQWEKYLANFMLTCTFRYTPMTELETFFNDVDICARLVSSEANADAIVAEASSVVDTIRTNRRTDKVPFNWDKFVLAYNDGLMSNLLELNLLFNLNNDNNSTTMKFRDLSAYILDQKDEIVLDAVQTGDPLVMSEDRNYYTGLLLGYKYHADSVFIYSNTVLNMGTDLSDAEQVRVLNGKLFKMPQRCIDPYSFAVKQVLVVPPWNTISEYRTWLSIIKTMDDGQSLCMPVRGICPGGYRRGWRRRHQFLRDFRLQ